MVDLAVDKVSLVDYPATEEEFLLLKRKEGAAMPTETEELVEEEIEKQESADLADLFGSAAAELNAVVDALEARKARKKPKGKDEEAKKAQEDFASPDEKQAFGELSAAVEKLIGFYGYPYPRPANFYPDPYFPYPRPYPLPQKFDPARLAQAITRVLAIPGIPDDVKEALQAVLELVEGGEKKKGLEDYVTRAEFENFVQAATQALQALSGQAVVPQQPEENA